MSLPEYYLITPNWSWEKLWPYLTEAVTQGVRLIQIRSQALSRQDLERLLIDLTSQMPAVQVLINSAYPESLLIAQKFSVGLHLQSSALMQMNSRILDMSFKIGASCHNRIELEQAEKLNLDFTVLSPVKKTSSHAEISPLGWPQFKEDSKRVIQPIFALGGLGFDDLVEAKKNGAYGIAGISLFVRRYSSS